MKSLIYNKYGLALVIIVGIAFFLRTYFPYDTVFTGEWVRFQWYDSWGHMRVVENLVQHFPHRIHFDPYTYYPHGQDVWSAPFYDLLLGFFVWLFGAGSPSREVLETTGAYFPAVLGALVTIPVYLIGRELFNRSVGILAAILIAVMPGQFLVRSLLGFTDHHVAEVLFSTLTMLFLIMAIKNSTEEAISFNSFGTADWRKLKSPLLYSLLTGISLGFYLLSWVGGALLVFTIFVFFVIQYIIDHLRGRPTDYLCITGTPVFFIAMLMVVPFSGLFGFGKLQIASLAICMMSFPALSILSLIMIRRNVRRAYYPPVVVILGVIVYVLLMVIDPGLLNSIIDKLNMLRPSESSRVISEAQPLTLSMAWEEFTTCFILSLISLLIIAYHMLTDRTAEKTLFFLWCLIMLTATISQNRFAYYFAVNVSLLAGYLSWRMMALVNTIRTSAAGRTVKSDEGQQLKTGRGKAGSNKKGRRKKGRAQKTGWWATATRYPVTRYSSVFIAMTAIFFLVFYPNIVDSIEVAGTVSKPTQDWHDALVWMRENTTDPFEDPDFYYALYDEPANYGDYSYPESAYGIMSWWDYGYWISYIAHRIPNANPSGSGSLPAAIFFTAQDESTASKLLDRLGSRYIIIDLMTAMYKIDPASDIKGYHAAIVDTAGKDMSEFYEEYYLSDEGGELNPVTLFYPEYYKSMSSRLYLFGGEEWIPDNCTWVISYDEKTDRSGSKYKEIATQQRFTTYDEANSYLEEQDNPRFRIVSNNPLKSPVPLEKLKRYKMVFKSPTMALQQGAQSISSVEIFEYLPQRRSLPVSNNVPEL